MSMALVVSINFISQNNLGSDSLARPKHLRSDSQSRHNHLESDSHAKLNRLEFDKVPHQKALGLASCQTQDPWFF